MVTFIDFQKDIMPFHVHRVERHQVQQRELVGLQRPHAKADFAAHVAKPTTYVLICYSDAVEECLSCRGIICLQCNTRHISGLYKKVCGCGALLP